MLAILNLALALSGTFAARELVLFVKSKAYRDEVVSRTLMLLQVKYHPALASRPILTHVRHRWEAGVPARETAAELADLLGWWGPIATS